MALSQSDMDALNQMSQGLATAGNIPWTTLLGFFPGDGVTPAAGTPSLTALNNAGFSYGPNGVQPSLASEEATGAVGGVPTEQMDELMGTGAPTYTVPGFGNMTAAQVHALPPEQQNAALISWSNVVSPGVKPAWGTLSGPQLGTAVDKMLSEIGSGAYKGYGQISNPTLTNQNDFAQQFGRLGSYGAPYNPNAPLTLAAQKQYMDAINNAPKGPADAFSYLAKEQSMANAYNPVAQLLGSNIQAVTGQSLANLSNTPTLTNTQLATDLVNSQNGGSVSPLTAQFLARSLQPPAYAPTAASGGSTTNGALPGAGSGSVPSGGTPAGGVDPTTMALINALHQSQPAQSGFQATTGLPTGFQTSLQQFNRLEPEAQSAFLDLQQTAGGQTPTDFQAGMKQGAPEFGKVAAGNIAPSAL